VTGQPISPKDSRTRLLLLFPGPLHNLQEYFSDRLTRLSEDFRGSVVVMGEQAGRAPVGAFDVTMLQVRGGSWVRDFFRYVRTALRASVDAERRNDPFDAVITYDPLKTGLAGLVVTNRRRIPLIVEVNGDYANPAVYSDIANPLARAFKRRGFVLLERQVLRRASGIKLLFPGQLDHIASLRQRTVVRTFPNYVDLSFFRDLGETKEVLFVGHPFYLKGVDLLIEAFKRVCSGFPEWKLKILGWFPDPSELNRAVDGHPRIEIHPPVARAEVATHIGRCGIFVLPSRTEAMGRVLLEAMACGKPRIGANVGGIPTVIEDGVDGLLFRSGDIDQLAQRLSELMADPGLRRRLGKQGATRARDEFTPQSYFELIREFYGAVLQTTQ